MKKARMVAEMWPAKLAAGGWRTRGRAKAFARETGIETWEDVSTTYSKCGVCGYVRLGCGASTTRGRRFWW